MVIGKPERAYELETDWVRNYAKTNLPSEAGFSFAPSGLRAAGVTLVNIRHAFRTGTVVFADKLDEPGAIWIVEGKDQDERWLRLELHVVSEILTVTLRNVKALRLTVETGNDAA